MSITLKCQLCETMLDESDPGELCDWDSVYYFLCSKCYKANPEAWRRTK